MVVFTHMTALSLYRLGLPAKNHLYARETSQVLARGNEVRCEVPRAWKLLRHVALNSDSLPGITEWSATTSQDADRSMMRAARDSLILERPAALHVLVPSSGTRHRAEGIVDHVVSMALPAHSLVPVDLAHLVPELPRTDYPIPKVYVTSPELTLVTLAGTMGKVRRPDLSLLAVVQELCGTYLRRPDQIGDPMDLDRRVAQRFFRKTGFRSTEAPITTRNKIESYLSALERSSAETSDRTRSPRGVAALRHACRYVVDGAASPMESLVTQLLCLPRVYGGYGLPEPSLNERLELTDRARRLAGQWTEVVDLLWMPQHVALEYDSDEFHVSKASYERILRDKHRVNAAGDIDVDVVTLTRDQFMDSRAFDAIAGTLAKRLGIRQRKPSAKTLQRRLELRQNMFSRLA